MRADLSIAVVGGGIVGASIAWRLAQARCRVTLWEARRLGGESSWSGAGMLAPGGEFAKRTEWSDFALASLRLYPAYVDELTRSTGIAIDYRACGAFDLAFHEAEALTLSTHAAARAAAGIESEPFPPGHVPGVPAAIAARYYPHDAVVNPRDVMRALAIACRREGVEIRELAPFPTALIDAFDAVVIAAGAWSSHIAIPGVALPRSLPVRGHLVAFDEYTGLCDSILRHNETYLLRRAPDAIIAGASTEQAGFDRTLDGTIANALARRAAQILPTLAERPFTCWNGLRPATESGEPAIGRVPGSSIWLAYGHYRNGILMAPATAERIARELTMASSQTDSLSLASHRQ